MIRSCWEEMVWELRAREARAEISSVVVGCCPVLRGSKGLLSHRATLMTGMKT